MKTEAAERDPLSGYRSAEETTELDDTSHRTEHSTPAQAKSLLELRDGEQTNEDLQRRMAILCGQVQVLQRLCDDELESYRAIESTAGNCNQASNKPTATNQAEKQKSVIEQANVEHCAMLMKARARYQRAEARVLFGQ